MREIDGTLSPEDFEPTPLHNRRAVLHYADSLNAAVEDHSRSLSRPDQ